MQRAARSVEAATPTPRAARCKSVTTLATTDGMSPALHEGVGKLSPSAAATTGLLVAALGFAGCTEHPAPAASPGERGPAKNARRADSSPAAATAITAANRAAADGRYDDAVAVLESFARTNALSADAALVLADLHLRAGRPRDAVRVLTPHAGGDVPASDVRRTLARALLAAGDVAAALRHLTVDAGLSPADGVHQELLGQALVAAADLPGARRALARAVELDPSRFEARLALARLTGREPIADVVAAWTVDLDARARQASDDAHLRVELARVHALGGRRADAERSLRQALELKPSLPEANLALARLLLASGRTDEAIPRLHAVLGSVRGHRQTNLLLAEHYEGAGDPARAAAHLQAAYDEPRPTDVTLRLASLHGQARTLDAALVFATTAVREAPGSAAAHAVLGRVHRLRGDTPAAFRAYETALRLDRDLTAAHLALDPENTGPEAVRAALAR